jgi:hypothetical protein
VLQFLEIVTGRPMDECSVEFRADKPVKRVALIVETLFVLMTASCAGVQPLPSVAPQSAAATAESARAPAARPSTSASAGQRDTKAALPTAKVPPPAPTAQATKKDSASPDVAKQKAPPLDLASLETRLKETKAIGVLTKIALKNQVDDLLGEFRAFYQGKVKTTLTELRRSYDLLVLKVLALLQEGDPPLASAIVASREAIWGILSDPAKFAAI